MFPFSPGSSKSANYLCLDIEMYNITIYYENICKKVIAFLSYCVVQIPDSILKIYQKRKITFN